jgi:hypothetical protein
MSFYWRMKKDGASGVRATWLKWGDSNTKFFHKVANLNRNKKLIWSIAQENEDPISGQEALKSQRPLILSNSSNLTVIYI